jgi:hypothetical protein
MRDWIAFRNDFGKTPTLLLGNVNQMASFHLVNSCKFFPDLATKVGDAISRIFIGYLDSEMESFCGSQRCIKDHIIFPVHLMLQKDIGTSMAGDMLTRNA